MQEDGKLIEPESLTRTREEYFNQCNSFEKFLTEQCDLGVDLKTLTGEFHEAYENWCRENNFIATGVDARAEVLRNKKCEPGSSNGNRVWKGVDLKK